jgi:hypothetical protein
MMKLKFLILAVLIHKFSNVHSEIVPLIDENYEDCMEGGSAMVLDMSNLKLVHQNDHYFLNGNFHDQLKLISFQLTITQDP